MHTLATAAGITGLRFKLLAAVVRDGRVKPVTDYVRKILPNPTRDDVLESFRELAESGLVALPEGYLDDAAQHN
jgi:hypothetical protein